MTLKNGSKKGFSLFTPLVGTAIVVITIMISSTIIQNDVRFSRAITSAYVISSQTTVGRAVSSDISSLLSNNLDKLLRTAFENIKFGITKIEIKCGADLNECKHDIKREIETVLNSDIDNSIRKNLYKGVIESIKTTGEASGYIIRDIGGIAKDDTQAYEDHLSALLYSWSDDKIRELTKGKGINDEGYYFVKLNSELLQLHKLDLALTLINQFSDDRFTIPLIPEYGADSTGKIDLESCAQGCITKLKASAGSVSHTCKANIANYPNFQITCTK
jgi:hypothetical protein